jgi:hypothetical protein
MLARDLPCVILAVDPAATSGWALLVGGSDPRGHRVGIATEWQDRMAAAVDASHLASDLGPPLVVVAETWPGLRGTALAGLGAQWGKWLAELERLDVPDGRIVRVDTGTWRKTVLGITRQSGEASKRAAMMRAHAVLGHDVTADEAEALCIGLFGLRSEKVAKAIGARELKRLGWSET